MIERVPLYFGFPLCQKTMLLLGYLGFFVLSSIPCLPALLFPRDSSSRESKTLDGIWQFRTCNLTARDAGFRERWYMQPLRKSGWSVSMPVPASYNDLTQDKSIRDFLGWAWYQKEFVAPASWKGGRRIFIRFGSVNYLAQVYLNGINVVNHTGGHLPFEVEVSRILEYSQGNLLTVAVSNILSEDTLPQGSVSFMTDNNRYPENFYTSKVNFDFFNYAGIHRSVVLYTTSPTYIRDISISTYLQDKTTGAVSFSVIYEPAQDSSVCHVTILDADSEAVAYYKGCTGQVLIRSAHFWWPIGMNDHPGYLYKLKVELIPPSGSVDVYVQPFGVRTVQIKDNQFLINGWPFYFMGFGKHEDSNIRGRGFDSSILVKDLNLVKWMGANSFRTSHYPYSEETMEEADAQGIVIIDECPAVGQDKFNSVQLELHLKVMSELIGRDKNHPSVVMWSVANEPRSFQPDCQLFFKTIVEFVRHLDSSRPVSAALNIHPWQDKAGQFMDVIMVNKYFGWYEDAGILEVIQKQLFKFIELVHNTYHKPVIMSEYGADTIPGYHMSPSVIFTEDYQSEFLMEYHQGFDKLRQQGYFIGELIWNFADFMTAQHIRRVVGNKKGIFTRERQPKAAAKILRCRYLRLSNITITDNQVYCPPF